MVRITDHLNIRYPQLLTMDVKQQIELYHDFAAFPLIYAVQ